MKAELSYTRSLSQPSYEEMIHELKKAAFQAPYESFYWYELMMKDPSSLPRGVHMLSRIENSTITAMTWKAILLSEEKPQEAFKLFEELVAKSPDNPHLRQAYADALYRNEKWKEAVMQYEEFLRVAPPFWKWKFDIQNLPKRDKVRYRVFFSEALDFYPLLGRLAESYEKIGNNEKADYFRKYAEGGPALKKFDF